MDSILIVSRDTRSHDTLGPITATVACHIANLAISVRVHVTHVGQMCLPTSSATFQPKV